MGPDFTSFDMRITRRFKMGEKANLQILAEGFNLFNRTNYASVNNIVGPSLGLAPGFTYVQRARSRGKSSHHVSGHAAGLHLGFPDAPDSAWRSHRLLTLDLDDGGGFRLRRFSFQIVQIAVSNSVVLTSRSTCLLPPHTTSQISQMTGAQAVVAALLRHGITAGFGIPSIHNIAIYEALRQTPEFHHWVVRHEQAAGFAADGFYRSSGRIAAVFASTGPGNLFTLVPLLESLQTNTPVLVIGTNIASSLLSKDRRRSA